MEEIWTTQTGDKIAVKDMTDSHIKNCIKCIKEERIDFYRIIELGYTADGDGDGLIYDKVECPEEAEKWLEIFENELNRRSLEQPEQPKEKTKKYKLFIRRYSIIKNDYVVEEKIVETNDIYHEIGYIYCTTLEDIRRIDYKELLGGSDE